MAEKQLIDPHLAEIIDYSESRRLPADEKRPRRIMLERQRFDIVDQKMLTYCDGDVIILSKTSSTETATT